MRIQAFFWAGRLNYFELSRPVSYSARFSRLPLKVHQANRSSRGVGSLNGQAPLLKVGILSDRHQQTKNSIPGMAITIDMRKGIAER